MRKLTTLAVTTVFALAITLGSTNRAEAHRGWGWGVGAGIATALILGGLYHHLYYGYRYGYYRPATLSPLRSTVALITLTGTTARWHHYHYRSTTPLLRLYWRWR
jgi:hypothetical protein